MFRTNYRIDGDIIEFTQGFRIITARFVNSKVTQKPGIKLVIINRTIRIGGR